MTTRSKPITERFVPSVAGIDLEHALNYTSSDEIPREWFYRSFTFPRTFYRKGSRPALEAFLESRQCGHSGGREGAREIIRAVYETISHFSLLGFSGEAARGLCEEGLLLLGQGWCNEQARVLAALSQVAGIPARLVFCGMPNGQGHVLTELFLEEKWALVDQTAAFLFEDSRGNLLNLFDLECDHGAREEMRGRYRKALQDERAKARDAAFWDQYVPYGVVDDSLLLFASAGFCNYFIH